jgi:DNA transformation protein
MTKSLSDLRGLGPKSQAILEAAGILTVSELECLGAVRAYARVKATCPAASLNLLWALEGALTGLSWQEVAKTHRLSLLLALESLESEHER